MNDATTLTETLLRSERYELILARQAAMPFASKVAHQTRLRQRKALYDRAIRVEMASLLGYIRAVEVEDYGTEVAV